MPDALGSQSVGHILLLHEVARIVVSIAIAVVIAKVSHEFGGGIAQMQRHGLVAGVPHQLQGLVDGQIGRIALWACGKIGRASCRERV